MSRFFINCHFSKIVSAGIVALSFIALNSLSARASDFEFDLTPFTGNPASVTVGVHQQSADTLRFTVEQNDLSMFGDLRGLFFHVNESIIDPTDLTFSFVAAVENITGNAITPTFTSAVGLNSIVSVVSGDNKTTPKDNFDVGFEFGSPGIGGSDNDVRSVIFDITKIGGLDSMTFMPVNMEYFMTARLTSVWNGVDREGSSKLGCCTTTVPEPDSTLGLLVLALGGFLWRRKKLS